MDFSLSTHWNAFRHQDGERLGEEIIGLGFSRIELGYDTHAGLLDGLLSLIKHKKLTCGSVHNYCPVPSPFAQGHPELFSLCSLNPSERRLAVEHTRLTLECAAEVGASTVVAHAGHIPMRPLTPKLVELASKGKRDSRRYERIKRKLWLRRQQHAPAHIEQLRHSLDALVPYLERYHLTLALENLPSWEAVPSTDEMLELVAHYPTAPLRAWHDTGHGRVLQNLELDSHRLSLRKLEEHLVGMHIHDVIPPASDHLMPPEGEIDFSWLASISKKLDHLVIEPFPGTAACHIIEAVNLLKQMWSGVS